MHFRRPARLAAVVLLAACTQDGPVTPSVIPDATTAVASQPNARWIVALRDDVTDVDGVARQLAGGAPERVYRHVIKGFAAQLSEAAAQALARNPLVRYVDRDIEMFAIATQTPATWGIDRIDQRNLPLSSSYTYNNDGAGVTAYILDTGLRYDHSEFYYSATDTRSRATFGYDAMGDGRNGADCHGHGTHVGGTVGGRTYGVAKQVNLVAVRVLGCTGSGSTVGIVAALDWMVSAHAAGTPAVGNMSLGGGLSTALNDAVTRAHNDGIVMVVAAGNSSADACGYSPASAPAAITVGSSTSTDARSSFSNWGNCVDFFAPGSSITSASYASATGTTTMSGTSMASPHVAGAAALYLTANPGASASAVRDGLFALTTKGVVSSALTTNNHLLYTLGIGSGSPPPPNTPPTAAFTYSCTGLTCTFTDGSTDSDGSIASRSWNFGDGTTSTATNPSKTYAAGGTYSVSLIVTDNGGELDTATANVTVSGSLPPVNIVLTSSVRTRGTFKVDLAWSGATASTVDVYRNGVVVATVANSGAHTDNLGKARGTYTHRVCHAGTQTCSNSVTNTF